MKVERQHWERKAARKVPTVAPLPPTKPLFLERAFSGRMEPEDQAYMARAILQLSDENAEMRERIRALEMAFTEMRGGR
jgi:hypothetical protein